MKTIGMIGGMSWESTETYYRIINETVKRKLGGFHSAKILLHSVDFAQIETCQRNGEWDMVGDVLARAAVGLQRAGAELMILCTNTMHKVAPQIEQRIDIPFLHIAEATASQLVAHDIKKVALLGTKYTMQQAFYRDKIEASGITVMIPNEMQMDRVNDVIFGELCLGVVSPQSKQAYIQIIDALKAEGAEGVILGCTEIGMLIQQQDTALPVFDTTVLHAKMAAAAAMA